MKKYLTILLISCLAGCFSQPPALKTGFEGKPMPSFNLLLTDSTTLLNTADIPKGNPIILFYFSPYCPYCKAQTEEMIDKMESMPNIQFYFVSNFPLQNLKQYAKNFKLEKYSNIRIGKDEDNYFTNYFKAPGVPYTAVYSSNKIFKQALIGNVGAKIVKEIASE